MKKFIIFFSIISLPFLLIAQGAVGIGTSNPNASAVLDIEHSNKGLLLPRLGFAQRPLSPTVGLAYYQTDNTPGIYFYNGAAWIRLVDNSNVGIIGSGATSTLAKFTSSNNIKGNAGLRFSSNRLSIQGLNDGQVASGFTNWISADIGGSGGNRIVMGIQNGEASIGAHNHTLSAWETLTLNPAGSVAVPSLVVPNKTATLLVNAAGDLSPITFSAIDNLGSHIATQNINLQNHVIYPFDGVNTATHSIGINNSGTVTLNRIPGADYVPIWANHNGQLNRGYFNADNMGGAIASMNLSLNNYKIKNAATDSGGIVISNDGHFALGVSNTTNIVELPTVTSSYAGAYSYAPPTFSTNFGTVSPTAYNPSYDPGPQTILIHGNNGFYQNISFNAGGAIASVASPVYLNMDFGTGQSIAVRRYIFAHESTWYSGSHQHTAIYMNCRVEASNDNANWTVLNTHNQVYGTNFATDPGPTYYKRFYVDVPITNTTQYRYYRLAITRFYRYNIFQTQIELDIPPTLVAFKLYTQPPISSYSAGNLSITPQGNLGIALTTAPTANVDVNGTLRFRNNASANNILVTNTTGTEAIWSNGLVINDWNNENTNLNNKYLSNNATATGISINNTGQVGMGSLPNANNQLLVSGAGGMQVSSTNNGSGTTDWIALNAGATAGNRLVGGLLTGTPTLGSHNNALNAWAPLVINPGGGGNATVTIGTTANATPEQLGVANTAVSKLIVEGSVRQGYYSTPVSIAANNVTYIYWNHNLGYGPVTMYNTDQNGGGTNMDFVKVTTFNNNENQTVFVVRNFGGSTATGTLRWVLVW